MEEGLAEVTTHKRTDNPSPHYQEMLDAEKRAKQAKVGKWGKQVLTRTVNDQSKTTAAKAKQLLPFLKRAGKTLAIVEYVSNAGRYKLFLEKENILVSFNLACVRCPFAGKDNSEPFGQEALEFVREKIHQRKITVEIETNDKGGNFVGYAWHNEVDMAELLLKEGFSTIHEPSASRSEFYQKYLKAVEEAKNARKNLWESHDPLKEMEKKQQVEMEENKQESLQVKVTCVVDGNWFYCQFVNPELEKMEGLMKELQEWNREYTAPSSPFYLNVGDICAYQAGDSVWYRVQLKEKYSSFEWRVFFIDFGDALVADRKSLRLLPSKFKSLPGQAKECYLALIKVPSLSDEHGDQAADYFQEMVENKVLMAQIEYRNLSLNTYFLTLADRESKVHINKAMVFSGLATVNKKVEKKQCEKLKQMLLEEQEIARKQRKNLWKYGDIPEDDEEDN